MAKQMYESPAETERMMEEICEQENCRNALWRVKANRGSPGVDAMSVEDLPGDLRQHWPDVRAQLLSGTYRPQPVKRVEIPKPDGGMRKLGVPTVVDRWIQQLILQVLQRRWDADFSDHSYGFRPERSAHQAVARAQQYIIEGCEWVVDLDLEKFFDRVNHDRLMSRIAQRISDKRLLKLIRAFLTAGVMEDGLVNTVEEGTPQGGPLSPLRSNLVLDELDLELERRGHRFVRYADDCNIYVRSERAGKRVMERVTSFIEKRLKLKVNAQKSAVARPEERTFLGFTFTRLEGSCEPRRSIAPKALRRFKNRVREITYRNRGVSMKCMVEELSAFLRGWRAYFGFCQIPEVFNNLDSWTRHRLRSVQWKQWRRPQRRCTELLKRGVSWVVSVKTASSSRGPWPISRSMALQVALPNAHFDSLGLFRLSMTLSSTRRTAGCGIRMSGGVAGERG
jgi:RNA-directed DNA polymerase